MSAAVRHRRVVVIGNMLETTVWFRGRLLQEMVAHGHEVTVCVPVPPEDVRWVQRLEAMKVAVEPIFLDRTALNPIAEAYALLALARRLRRLRPDVVLASMIKPVIYGSFAARLAGVRSICSIVEGLGYAFNQDRNRIALRVLVELLYKSALAFNRKVFFLNPHDQRLFETLGIVRPGQSLLLDGVGVDLDWYRPAALPRQLSFVLIARFIRQKGLAEYVAAARRIKAQHSAVRFRLVGWIDANPSAIRPDELQSWIDEGVIEYLGKLDEVRTVLTQSSVFVLPSYYPEGRPRSILEAMATGRAIITTDTPGCRDTVVNGANGILVPARNVPALEAAMRRFIEEPALAAAMGAASRRIAETRYDVNAINQCILEHLEL